MGKIRVMIVDDSLSARLLMREILSRDEEIEVVGEAENGRKAVAKVPLLKPDIVLMDIEMPVMDGLEAIEHIMSKNAVPIFVITMRDDADIAYKAISKGALDVLPKPDLKTKSPGEFIRQIKLMSKVRVISHIKATPTSPLRFPPDEPGGSPPEANTYSLVAIAASTGGPNALAVILPALPKDFPVPVVVSQHIFDEFVSGMVRWLDDISVVRVKLGEDGEYLRPGTVYVSPSSCHMTVSKSMRIRFQAARSGDIYFPSCDLLLSSVAESCGAKSIGVILTGMGSDGVLGMTRIHEAGGFTMAQDKESSVVYGMNRAAIEKRVVRSILPTDHIGGRLMALVAGSRTAARAEAPTGSHAGSLMGHR